MAEELQRLDLAGVRGVSGGVEFRGGWSGVYRANLCSRVASRVLVRVARFDATSFRRLAAGFAAVPWREWLPGGCRVEVRVACHRSRLYHTGRIHQELVAVLASGLGARGVGAGEGEHRLQVRLQDDQVELSLDTSGEHLHRRGYRDHAGPAPLRENLAAGLLARAGWDGAEPLLDPCCGSGTFAVEAARLAAGIPPGAERGFAFQHLPLFKPRVWEQVVKSAGPATAPQGSIYASDREPEALALTARAARRAGVADAVQVACLAIEQLEAPCSSGLLVANPPYGRRLSGGTAAYQALGHALRGPLRDWRWAVVVPGKEARRALGLVPSASYSFRNGGIGLRFELGEAQGN